MIGTGAIRLDEYDVEPRFAATVVSTERIMSPSSPLRVPADEEVRELVLDVDRPDFPYEAGQSLGVIAPGSPALGRPHHFRLYSVADLPERNEAGKPRIKICVRRCVHIDTVTGERHLGVASNYLCDLKPADTLSVNGPFGLPFAVPQEQDAHLILIGTGTGIAPFRAFVKHIYRDRPDWTGRIWLFNGARSGLELLYMNDQTTDFVQYYDWETFEAFRTLSPRPGWADRIAWDYSFAERLEELWSMLSSVKTYVFVAGQEHLRGQLDERFMDVAGSREAWARRKAALVASGRWVELLY
jgi:ferredoxin--NADP+ reductase